MLKLPDKLYDVLKWLTLIVIPAIGTLYLSLSNIWNLQFGQQISATCQATALFVGIIIGISQVKYNGEKKNDV